jgi:hypothetical protein
VRRVRKNRRFVGPSSDLSRMRRNTLLRQFAKSSRDQARACKRPPCYRFGAAERALVVLLPRQRFFRVLDYVGDLSRSLR